MDTCSSFAEECTKPADSVFDKLSPDSKSWRGKYGDISQMHHIVNSSNKVSEF